MKNLKTISRRLILIVILLFVVLSSCHKKSKYIYSSRKLEINLYRKSYTVKSDFEKGLEKLKLIDTIYNLNILNDTETIRVEDFFLNKTIYSIYMGKIRYDSVFCRVNYLFNLKYKCGSFNPAVLGCDELVRLNVDVLDDSIRSYKLKANKKLEELVLNSKFEYDLDSAFFNFSNLTILGGSFNPFKDLNYNIYSKMPKLLHLRISNIDLRQFEITHMLVHRLMQYITFRNCKFTRKQKVMLRKYVNLNIT